MKPSEFYRKIRPEFFSDSDIQTGYSLPKEVLELELDKITTNQKENAFEVFARRLAEKRISPNLIPQVGPTGGGDGKTDSESHLVSESISDRWYIPEHGWSNNEKWAFAISAQADWKSKLRKDIQSIKSTGRDYTQIFFITNQKIASKTKKELEESHKKEFRIPITILDGQWIIESVFSNDLQDIAVDSLNLSDSFKTKKKKIGKNDTERLAQLEKLESEIANPNRYTQYDYQLVEDAIEAATLSRMLEKPKEEVMGRFARAFRFASYRSNSQQMIRLHYQRAWTSFQYYDDYPEFLKDFKSVKELVQRDTTIPGLELYFNLFNLLRNAHYANQIDLSTVEMDIATEEQHFRNQLGKYVDDPAKPSSSLICKTHLALIDLTNALFLDRDPNPPLLNLKSLIESSRGHIEYPFEQFQEIIESFGCAFVQNETYDLLIDSLATAAEKRASESASGAIFLRRGGEKYRDGNYKKSLIYFGKSLLKLAKEEETYGFGLALRGLAESYSSMGLLWAANTCYVANCSLTLKTFFSKGTVDPRTYNSVVRIMVNELYIGRIPSFLLWNQLFQVLDKVPRNEASREDENDNIEDGLLFDACLAVRMLHTKTGSGSQFLPEIFEKNDLYLAEGAMLYSLGYTELLLTPVYGIPAKSETELDAYYAKWANQPFVHQIRYATNVLFDEEITFDATILGCTFKILFKGDQELFWAAEMLLAFFEGFLGTSLNEVVPSTEVITLRLFRNKAQTGFIFTPLNDSSTEIAIELNSLDFNLVTRPQVWDNLIKLFVEIVGKNFVFKDAKLHLANLFESEEVGERIGLLLEHRKFSVSVLGSSPHFFLKDWSTGDKLYPNQRAVPLAYKITKESVTETREKMSFENAEFSHARIKVNSVINNLLWDQARWQAFGAVYQDRFFGIFIGFENIKAGKKIFAEWTKRFGEIDEEDKIRVSIIKGVDKKRPTAYRVIVSAKFDTDDLADNNRIITAIRFHEMVPQTSKTLDDLIARYTKSPYYSLFPAAVSEEGAKIEPEFEFRICKKELFIRNAWEIGDHDPDLPAISIDDDPIIPDGEQDPPILKALERIRQMKQSKK